MKYYNLIIKNLATGEVRSIKRLLTEAHKESLLKNLFNAKTQMELINITELDEE